MKKTTALCLLLAGAACAQAKSYTVASPDGALSINVDTGKELTWSVNVDGDAAVLPSPISLTLSDGRSLGRDPKVTKSRLQSVDTEFATPLYHKTSVTDRYNELTLDMRGGYALQLRAYDDAAAYRFILRQSADSVTITDEQATFAFGGDRKAWLPFNNDLRDPSYPYSFAFESYYDEIPLAQMPADTLSITPALIELPQGRKALVMEGLLDNYPGMFLRRSADGNALCGAFAPVPASVRVGGFNRLNLVPVSSAGHIARTSGRAVLPWRVVAVVDNDTQLPDLDLAMRLSEPSRIADTSWIRPGKVAWDWWNDWGITGVDFEAGINTRTYMHYIDFAARKGLEYVILDEGWAKDNGDILDINPAIDLDAIIKYAESKGVSIILWATWRQLKDDCPALMKRFADMGVKGFKVDFFDRADQTIIASVAHIAQTAADNRMLLDLHGFRPTGLHRPYPNIVNYEGVKGLENYKWTPFGHGAPDQLRYDVSIPFIRMVAGTLDYTPGAMTNATAASYRASNDAPMSLGTRAHQVAMYVIYDGALQMLADSPSAYDLEPACADFMASIPTVYDETRVLTGSVGEYVAIARRKGDTWYVGAMTNTKPRTLSLDTSFLAPGTEWEATILSDGINAAKHPTDHRITASRIKGGTAIETALAPGGGWTAIIRPAGR